jgi:large subunit ribosomal protein L6
MSRIGKKQINIPEKVEVIISDSTLTVKGPLGEAARSIPETISVVLNDKALTITPKEEGENTSVLWGTFASHVSNMIEGVSKGFQKKLQVEGIGYRVEQKGTSLNFSLGFSHPVEIPVPEKIKVAIEKNVLTISGNDKEEVGSFAANLRALKTPEPYKGKGIRYTDEVVKIKQGKKTVA